MGTNTLAAALRKMADGVPPLAAQLDYELDFTEESIDDLESYLADIHEHLQDPECEWTEDMKLSAAMNNGAYFGEVIRRNFGGDWVEDSIENPTFVIGHVEFRPAEKVYMRLNNGPEDHIGHYYKTILTCLKKSAETSDQIIVE